MERKKLWFVSGVLVAVTALISWIEAPHSVRAAGAAAAETHTQSQSTSPDAQQRIARGRYLVTIAGCNDCHTPFKLGLHGPEPDMTRMLSGHPQGVKLPPAPAPRWPWIWSGAATNTAFAGPWGVTYAANLTPHPVTGMGIWDENRFIKAMRTGRHFGEARPIMPPMPWQSIGKMTDEDLKSIYAYLRSIPPIDNQVPDYQPPQPTTRKAQ